MHELEAILHEYLSFNWDRMEEVNTANAPLQRKEGLACPWRPSKDIHHSVSAATYRKSPCWDDHAALREASVSIPNFLDLGDLLHSLCPSLGSALHVVASNAFSGTAEFIAALGWLIPCPVS